MDRKIKCLLISMLFLVLSLFSGCKSQSSTEQNPAAFTADFITAVDSGDRNALASYEGNTYRLHVKVDGIVMNQYIHVGCTDKAKISVYVPQAELESLHADDVAALEGTVKRIESSKTGGVRMIIDPARMVDRVFEVAGEVEEIYHDWSRDGQDYAAIWDSSVVLNRQINIYLPKGHHVRVGDKLAARGALLAPSRPQDFSIGFIRGRGPTEVFIMLEPEWVETD